MGKQDAPPVDYKGLQEGIKNAGAQQLANNRPDISTPWATQTWQDGKLQTSLNGGLGDAATALTQQAGQALANPFDFGQFGPAGTGDTARDQAITGAYGQATSRLDPQWQQREAAARTQLLNQGLDPSSEAFRTEMGNLGMQRNDAYQGAMSGAIAQGTAAGDSAFRNNMMSRQQAISEALRGRTMPLENLQQLQGFLAMPGFNQDNSTLPTQMGITSLAQGAHDQVERENAARAASTTQGIGAGAGVAAALASLAALF